MLDLIVGGLAIGSVFALVSLGLVVVFRATGIVNFAQGELLMVGAYAHVLTSANTSSPILQLAATALSGVAVGILCFLVAHVLLRRADELVVVLGTFALSMFLQVFARIVETDTPVTGRAWLFGDADVRLGDTVVAVNALLTIGVALVLTLGLAAWFRYSLVGKAMETVAENQRTAALTGIRVRRMLLVSWVIGGVLAALAGMLLVPITGAFPTMGATVLLPAFFVVVIGGLENLEAALVGGFILGLLQTFAVVLVGGAFRDVVIFAVLLLVLLIRPSGLLGAVQLRRY